MGGQCCSGRDTAALSPVQEEQFKEALRKFFWNDDDSELTSAFKLLNTSNTGNLTSAEMEGKLIPMFKDFNLGKNEVKIMIEEADDDKNGTVEADEFIGVLKKNKDSGEGFWGRLKLFDAIGGKKGVQAIVTKMYEKIKQDEEMMAYFEGKNVQKIVEQQYLYFASAVGGPVEWNGRSLKKIHTGMEIKEDDFDKYADMFKQSAIDCGKKEEQADAIKDLILSFKDQVAGL